jgi:hypothetical protein
MKILSIRPAPPGGKTIAHVDVEIVDGVKLFGLRVSRAEDSSYRVYGQNSARGRTCSFSPAIVAQIAAATISSFESTGHRKYDHIHAA